MDADEGGSEEEDIGGISHKSSAEEKNHSGSPSLRGSQGHAASSGSDPTGLLGLAGSGGHGNNGQNGQPMQGGPVIKNEVPHYSMSQHSSVADEIREKITKAKANNANNSNDDTTFKPPSNPVGHNQNQQQNQFAQVSSNFVFNKFEFQPNLGKQIEFQISYLDYIPIYVKMRVILVQSCDSVCERVSSKRLCATSVTNTGKIILLAFNVKFV